MEGFGRQITGSVVDGVEDGSVVLVADDGLSYQIGRRWKHLVGRRVVVTARPRPGVVSTAQQGLLVRVDDAIDLGPGVLPPRAV